MSNLLTSEQKKSVRLEYLMRLLVMTLFLLSILGMFFLAYTIPYYFSVSQKDLIVATQFQTIIQVENRENVGESSNKVVRETNDRLRATEAYSNNVNVLSEKLLNIAALKNSGIRILKIGFIPNRETFQFTISGLANSRENLLGFVSDLRTAGFTDVDSPVSSLAKSTDIPFSLLVKLKK